MSDRSEGVADMIPCEELLPRADWTFAAQPLFVVGCARSGTTWLQSMLSSHPEVHTGPETHFFAPYQKMQDVIADSPQRNVGFAAYLSPDRFDRLVEASFWYVVSSLPEPVTPPTYFLEKSPHHCDNADLILRAFPKARFIHLVRDGRAVVASLIRVSQTWGRSWAPRGITEATRMWQERVQCARGIAQKVPVADQFLEVRYESLRADPERGVARLFDWLGLSYDIQQVRAAVERNALDAVRGRRDPFPDLPRPVAEGPSAGTAAGFPADFVGSAPKDPKEVDLTVNEQRLVDLLAGNLLQELGYPVLG